MWIPPRPRSPAPFWVRTTEPHPALVRRFECTECKGTFRYSGIYRDLICMKCRKNPKHVNWKRDGF